MLYLESDPLAARSVPVEMAVLFFAARPEFPILFHLAKVMTEVQS